MYVCIYKVLEVDNGCPVLLIMYVYLHIDVKICICVYMQDLCA